MNKLSYELFFPTVISHNVNEQLASYMLPIATKILNDRKNLTNTWGYKTTYSQSESLHTRSDMQPFVDYVYNSAQQYVDDNGYDLDVSNLKMQLFASEINNNDYHTSHNHPNSVLSGVFYLEVYNDSSKILFHEPRSAKRFTSLPIKKHTHTNQDIIFVQPQNGLLLLWESWLYHEVTKSTNDKPRKTLVFNLV